MFKSPTQDERSIDARFNSTQQQQQKNIDMKIDNSSEQIENDVKHYLNKIVKLLLVVCAYCKLKMISELKEKRKKKSAR
jgi:hypothetical protein